MEKKLNEKFIEIEGEIKVGDKVKMRQNRQVGIVKEIKGKKSSSSGWYYAHDCFAGRPYNSEGQGN